ncbi:MAG: YkgJ family cysteine cluster protein [Deltaproteobacteria bacterium]|nr:MAG: YkgJ family cysteine cluster protein [Deltaproteobacteria bacterium]
MIPERPITHRYEDPVDAVWVACAERIGYRIRRADDVYAGFDGIDTITIAAGAALDPDDSLAQLIFHELCHALVASDDARKRPDWGLENVDDRDLVSEHACHRLQAALADRFGLRGFMAATTQWRPHWDALPADPLDDDGDPAVPRARLGWTRARKSPWREALDEALAATAAIAAAIAPVAGPDSLWSRWTPLHPLGSPLGPEDARCADCAWRFAAGPGYPVDRCRQHRDPGAPVAPRIDPDWRACARFEPPVRDADCADCGACCRQAFHLVPVSRRSPLLTSHRAWIVRDAHGAHLPRPDGFCVALSRGPEDGPPYLCTVYDERPKSCRDFPVGGDHCLLARQRVGLSAKAPWGR